MVLWVSAFRLWHMCCGRPAHAITPTSSRRNRCTTPPKKTCTDNTKHSPRASRIEYAKLAFVLKAHGRSPAALNTVVTISKRICAIEERRTQLRRITMTHAMSGKGQTQDTESDAKQTDQSSWTSTFNSINPWASNRGQAPPATEQPTETEAEKTASANEASINQDHLSVPIYGKSFRKYPDDCPPLRVRWFHAVDVCTKPPITTATLIQRQTPKRTPHSGNKGQRGEKDNKSSTQKPKPKKFTALSKEDSKRVEKRYQHLLEATEDHRGKGSGESEKQHVDSKKVRVPVNEDFLFDVDIFMRELAPVYWAGPVYESKTKEFTS